MIYHQLLLVSFLWTVVEMYPAWISEHCFEFLDAPVKRVASKDTPIAYAPVLEDQILVQTSWLVEAIEEVVAF